MFLNKTPSFPWLDYQPFKMSDYISIRGSKTPVL